MTGILVVDDSPTIRHNLKTLLEGEGLTVTTAPDGLSAFVALQTATPDLIILDIGLPYINGMDLCAAIRRIPTYSHIPVIIVTGSHKQIDATMANSYGAVGYFTKPYDDAELLAAINSCLASVN